MRRLVLAALAVAVAPATNVTADLVSDMSVQTLSPDATDFYYLPSLNAFDVAFGIVTPIAGVPSDFDTPDTALATFFADEVGPGNLQNNRITRNDDSDADNNLGDDSLGSLFRMQPPFADDFAVGVTGYENRRFRGDSHSQQGAYAFTYAVVDPTVPGGDFADNDATNGSLAGADTLSLGAMESKVAVNSLNTPGDVDYYQIDLNAGDILTLMTAPLDSLGADFDGPDTMIVFFDGAGNILFDDDDAGGDFSDLGADGFFGDALGSALHFFAPIDDTYYFAITGYGDDDALGLHGEAGGYALLASRISAVPEVNFLGLLGVSAVATIAGRRRREG